MRPARLLSAALVSGLVLLAVILPSSAIALAPGQLFGFGDQTGTGPATVFTPGDYAGPTISIQAPVDLYADARVNALKPTITRYIAGYNVARSPSSERDRLDAWYAIGKQRNLRMLIAFAAFKARKPPSAAAYRRGLQSFHARYPLVNEWAPMNEANHITQPTYRRPDLAVRYTKIARSVCPNCTLVQLTLVLGFENDLAYAKRFMKLLPRSERGRMIWGLHTYSDTNRSTSVDLVRFLKAFPTGAIWFTESAAWAQFAPPTWPYSLARQARRTALIFRQAIAASRRVKRVYWYQWGGLKDHRLRWDSGLVDSSDKPRPAYAVALRERFRTHLSASELRQYGLADVRRAANHR